MFKTYTIIFLTITFLFSSLSAESLINKIERLNALKKDAKRSKEDGFYDQSIEYSRKIKNLTFLIEKVISSVRLRNKLRNQIKVAKQIGADKNASDDFSKGVDFYNQGGDALAVDKTVDADYKTEQGLEHIRLAIEKTKKIFENRKNQLANAKNYEVEVVEIDNKFYVVRLIPKRRDSLWRIAEYEFVYGDPFKWKHIYKANTNIIKNPDLIYPGQKLLIPPLANIEGK